MIRLALLLLCLALTGCGTVETARATVQADQAIEATQQTLNAPAVTTAVAQLTTEQQEVIGKAFRDAMTLLGSARGSLAPALALTAEGKPVQVQTTVEGAVASPQAFAAMAAHQTGRAEKEVEDIAAWRDLRGAAWTYGEGLAGNWISQALLGMGGLGTVVAVGLKAFGVIRIKTKAVQDAVAAGDELAAAAPDQVADVKAKHIKRQIANGTHAEIAAALAKKRAAPHA